MKRTFLIGFAALCAPIAGALASNWVTVSQSGTGATIEVDLDSIRSSGGRVKAWTRWSYTTPQEVKHSYPPKTYTSSKDLVVYNCYERSSATIQSTSYSQNGEVVDSRSVADVPSAYSEVVPDSVGESILDAVCGRKSSPQPSSTPLTGHQSSGYQAKSATPRPKVTKGWKSDWGGGILAIASYSPCPSSDLKAQGYTYDLNVSIPASRVKNKSEAWKISGGRATTVQGCWYHLDGDLVHAKMHRKKDGRTWEDDMNFGDGKWTQIR